MKVQICENVSVDVETTVDVDVNDVLMEFSRRIESAAMNGDIPYKSAFLPLVDFSTKLLDQIPLNGIGKCSASQRDEVVRRLREQADRWDSFAVKVEP